MIDTYIKSELSPRNEFRADFECQFNNIKSYSLAGRARSGIKIDTGACGTLIPLKTLGWTTKQIDNLIEHYYYSNKRVFSSVRGVESTNKETLSEVQSMNLNDLKNYNGLAIRIKVDYIKVGSFRFNNIELRVTTRTDGNILLGMDIMKDWDIHIGKDVNTEEILFIACPYNKINNDYLLTIDRHFNIGSSINSAILRDKMQTAER